MHVTHESWAMAMLIDCHSLYITVATAACVLAMAADYFMSSMSKRYWQKCKFFSLNAFSLTVVAVTMKLPVDLTITDITDEARICSLAFMCICMNNFMISFGSMEENEIVPNIAALGILVITITVNVCIHIVQILPSISGMVYMFPEQILSLVIMLLSLAMSCSMSLMVPSAKRYIELKYNEKHKLVLTRQVNESIDEVEILVKGYWVMAETASPQFVLARSPISSISALLCTLTVILLSYQYQLLLHPKISSSELIIYCDQYTNNYSFSITMIVYLQFAGVIVGSIGPISRWFTAWTIKVTETEQKSLDFEACRVEGNTTSIPNYIPRRQ